LYFAEGSRLQFHARDLVHLVRTNNLDLPRRPFENESIGGGDPNVLASFHIDQVTANPVYGKRLPFSCSQELVMPERARRVVAFVVPWRDGTGRLVHTTSRELHGCPLIQRHPPRRSAFTMIASAAPIHSIFSDSVWKTKSVFIVQR
jgi:hypothetical protein